MRQVYTLDPLADLYNYRHVAVDESLFSHEALSNLGGWPYKQQDK